MSVQGITNSESYLVVGAGVFGLSAALEIKRSKPSAQVRLLDQTDFPNQASASYDHNKIIRTDYRDIFYMKLALEALDEWTENPFYQPFYHETGMMFLEHSGKGVDFFANYDQLDHASQACFMSVKEACHSFSWFRNANWTGVQRAYYNPRSGWGDAVPALNAVLREAKRLGVVYMKRKVERLRFEQSDNGPVCCLGVQTTQGVLDADHVLLCTGAGTAKLLADSAPDVPEMQVSGRLVAAAALSCMVKVRKDFQDLYRNAPVIANLMHHTNGEALPMTPDGYIKVNYELSFTNIQDHLPSGSTFSTLPIDTSQLQWTADVPQQLKDEATTVLHNTYGPADALQPEAFRLCWDAITPTQDWIISPHDHCDGLYIAAGGSFHSWKFFPILGKQILAMLDGRLDSEKAARWGWTRSATDGRQACDTYCPKRDLKDLLPST